MTTSSVTGSLLEITLAAAARDRQLATPDGQRVTRLTDGVCIKPLTTHADARGSLMELFDPRWEWPPDPIVFAYTPSWTTIDLLELLKPRTTVYDIVDHFPGPPQAPKNLNSLEDELLRRSSRVFTTAPVRPSRHVNRHPRSRRRGQPGGDWSTRRADAEEASVVALEGAEPVLQGPHRGGGIAADQEAQGVVCALERLVEVVGLDRAAVPAVHADPGVAAVGAAGQVHGAAHQVLHQIVVVLAQVFVDQ